MECQTQFLCTRDRILGILFLSCQSFCHSIILSKTLTLLITFEQWVLELWYFTWSLTHFLKTLTLLITFEKWVPKLLYSIWFFLVIRPFRGFHFFVPCDLDLGVWPTFLKTLTLIKTFEQRVLELWYFAWVFLVIRPFCGYHYFLPCDLDLGVFKNFNFAKNFWTVSATALILHMGIPCDKTFPWVPLFFFNLWHWPWKLTHFLKNLTLLITFEQWVL